MAEQKTKVTRIKKADTSYREGVITSNAWGVEDEFSNLYVGAPGADAGANIIRPPYDLKVLAKLVQENNALGPCVSAMEVNIGGTGYTIHHKSGTSSDTKPEEVARLSDMFQEPYPGVTFTYMKRQLTRDQEGTGNGYLEVIRNAKDEIVFYRRIDPVLMRVVRLDNPITVKKKIVRNGQELSVVMSVRERRFAQSVNNQLMYFKEYGATRDLDKTTGRWADAGQRLPLKLRATEVIHFKCVEDLNTPYGIPRWMCQSPSVVGSRKAEIFNLDFFDSGGIPPIIAFLMGSSIDPGTKRALENMFSGKGNNKHRGAVVEVAAASGDIDKAGNAGIKVERFGTERQQDSMFGAYDKRCEDHVRCAFRLPPLFVGRAEDFTFATAYASYVIAEAQVFAPERQEFDDIMNNTIMKELNPDYRFRSNPLAVQDIEQQLRGLELVSDYVDGKDQVTAVNEITKQNLKYTKPKVPVLPGTQTLLPNGATQPVTADGGRDSNTTGKPRKVTTASPNSAKNAGNKTAHPAVAKSEEEAED